MAAGGALVFGQQIEKVAALTWDAATITDELATIILGQDPIALQPPLDEPLRQLAARPQASLTAAHPDSRWIFPGYSPGRPITGSHLRGRLQSVISTRAARLGSLHELTKLAPTTIIAEVLGYHPSTIEKHAIASASTYAQYVAILDS